MVAYELVSMFAADPSGGSQLAVVPRGDLVPAAAMPAAVERMKVAEVAFVLPPTFHRSNYRVRAFTATGESPGGGHASVGTATTLVRLGVIPAGLAVQECGEGRQVLFAGANRGTHFGRGYPRVTPLSPAPVVAAVGLTLADVGSAAPRSAGFGATFPMLPVHRTSLARAQPDYAQLHQLGLGVLLLFHWDASTRTAYARLFAPGFGMPEDPACSPVALALGVFLTDAGWLPATDGVHSYTIHQGAEVSRPAVLAATVSVWRGKPVGGAVTGEVVPVATGDLGPQ